MPSVTKICFPYLLPLKTDTAPMTVVFFGTDYYNLPADSNQELFIARTNDMLRYIEHQCPGGRYVYQPHPNETEEYNYLELGKFSVGEKQIAELFLYENAETITHVFSACSGASISAYAMGFASYLFLDPVEGALSVETIQGYRSYFGGLPENFFIKSFNDPLPERPSVTPDEQAALQCIQDAITIPTKTVWVITADPASALRANIIIAHLKQQQPHVRAVLLMIQQQRWSLALEHRNLFAAFDEIRLLPHSRVWYSMRPNKILHALKAARALRKLPLEPGDVLLSMSHMLFEENCLLSYYPQVRKVLLVENRWYEFVYDDAFKLLPQHEFVTPFGVRVFNYLVEPLLKLQPTIFREYKDGRVVNLARYRRDLSKIYSAVLVLVPSVAGNQK